MIFFFLKQLFQLISNRFGPVSACFKLDWTKSEMKKKSATDPRPYVPNSGAPPQLAHLCFLSHYSLCYFQLAPPKVLFLQAMDFSVTVINSLESIKERLETSIDARMQSMKSSLSNNASSLDRLEFPVRRIEQMVRENTNKKK